MKQRTFFKKPTGVKVTTPELEGYHRIIDDEEHHEYFESMLKIIGKDLLFDHCRVMPFAYYNRGYMEMYINDDWRDTGYYLPIIKKHPVTPRYELYCPIAPVDIIYDKMVELNEMCLKIKHGKKENIVMPIKATFVPSVLVEVFKKDERFKVSKSGTDYVDNIVVQSQLKGGQYKRLRNHISKAERTYIQERGGHYERLSPKNVHLAVALFKEWNATQGKKYMRGAVGRDIDLVEYYASRMTDDIVCELVIVDGKAVSCIFSSIYKHDPTQSVAVMAKSLTDYTNVSYMNELHCKKILVEKGVVHENVAGIYGAGTKMSKGKWKPEFTRNVFTVQLKGD